ncbi:hypothetical protein TWF281_008662 [Arthrobotrys megalospora]
MMLKSLLAFLSMRTVVLGYEMAFLENLDPNIDDFDPDDVIWNQYDSASGARCTAIPPGPNNYIQEIILRIPADEIDPPKAMAFFNDDIPGGSPGPGSCNMENIVFVVRWYPRPNTQQIYFTIDGAFTHFVEVGSDSNWRNWVSNMKEGDVLQRDSNTNNGWEILSNDVELSMPYIPLANGGSENEEAIGYLNMGRSAVQSVATMEAESMGEPGAPSRQDSVYPAVNTVLNRLPEGIEEEIVVPPGQEESNWGDQTMDPFEQMYAFERRYPNVWVNLVQMFADLRETGAETGLYIPIPQGLRNRYSDEELEALGLAIDPLEEQRSHIILADARRANPALYATKVPWLYRIFTGEENGLFDEIAAGMSSQPVNIGEGTNMVQLQPLVAGSQPSDVGYEDNMQLDRQSIQPDTQALANRNSLQVNGQSEQEPPIQSVQWDDSNIDPSMECLIEDLCLDAGSPTD